VFEDSDNEGSFSFDVETKFDGDLYMYLPACPFSDSMDNCKIFVNDVKLSGGTADADYFTNETWTIVNLGSFGKGEHVDVRVEFSGGKLYLSTESPYYFYQIDYAKMVMAFDQLASASMDIVEYGNDYVEGNIYLPEGQELIFTTIPYDEGWKVYVDGKKVEPVMVLDSLLAVPSTAGEHDIRFVYRPDCAVFGGILSVLGILAFVALVIWSNMRRIRALAKFDDGKERHFFYYGGDAVCGWDMEAAETDEKPEAENPETVCACAEENAPGVTEEAPEGEDLSE
jgi:uncharacterized membrane protein YfhO